jgi:hypothetical protein
MAKANEKQTRGKRADTGAARRASRASRGRAALRSTSGAKRGAKDRLVTAPAGRSRHGEDFVEQKRKSMAAHRRQQTPQVGKITAAGA